MKRQMILLRNLSCPSCAAKLEQAARKLPGMVKAEVAFGSGALHVEYDAAQVGEVQLRSVIERLGLEVAAVVARP